MVVEAGQQPPVVDLALDEHAVVGVPLAVGQLEVLAVQVVVGAAAGVSIDGEPSWRGAAAAAMIEGGQRPTGFGRGVSRRAR
ncbi:MAG: hypothetical protein KC583_05975 [Myxococcales bacterium]|nr:hypothetical protein [Myxococcales bacterium]